MRASGAAFLISPTRGDKPASVAIGNNPGNTGRVSHASWRIHLLTVQHGPAGIAPAGLSAAPAA
jgi:hypothetical protein